MTLINPSNVFIVCLGVKIEARGYFCIARHGIQPDVLDFTGKPSRAFKRTSTSVVRPCYITFAFQHNPSGFSVTKPGDAEMAAWLEFQNIAGQTSWTLQESAEHCMSHIIGLRKA
jgi:hypothetical protein